MIVFYQQEIDTFLSSEEKCHEGLSYEWEGENVVHIRTMPLCHSFGKRGEVLFLKSDTALYREGETFDKKYSYVVFASTSNPIVVIRISNESVIKETDIQYIPSKQNLYSRHKGLLELDILEQKRVMIIGLGSFGSQIAVELAKAGVGKFSLFDFDRVELHNLVRHSSYINDLGRLKTDVICDSIKGKNPYAQVDKYPINMNHDLDLLYEQVSMSDIVICATDNNASRYNLSEALVKCQKIGIFGRAITRAEGGDVFRYRPGGPCYCCLIGLTSLPQDEITNEDDLPVYMSAEDAQAAIQVGLSADIEPITNLMVKLTLVELSKGSASGISSLEEDFVYDYYIWANRRERNYKNWPSFPSAINRPTILRWYGARINKSDNCPVCSSNAILDTGVEKSEIDLNEFDDLKLD